MSIINRFIKTFKAKQKRIGIKTMRDIFYIQIPKILFTGFFCIIIWKIHERIKYLKGEESKLYTSRTIRVDKVNHDNNEFDKMIEYCEALEKEEEEIEKEKNPSLKNLTGKEISLAKMNRKERDSYKPTHEYTNYNEKELNVLSEFEDWANSLKEKQSIYSKKTSD